MKKGIFILCSVMMLMGVTACTNTKTDPIKEDKIIKDITEIITKLPNFSELISIEITSKTLDDKDFKVESDVEFKNDVATIKGTVSVDYYKSDSVWLKKYPELKVDSAVAFKEPKIEDIISVLPTLNRSHLEDAYEFDDMFFDYEMSDKAIDFTNNQITYEFTSRREVNHCKADLILGVDVRYTYSKGWQAVAITHERFVETTTWSGKFKADFEGTVHGLKTLTIDLSGFIVIENNETGNETISTNSTHANFTLDGITYAVDGEPAYFDDKHTNGREISFLYNQSNALVVAYRFYRNPIERWFTYEVILDGKSGKLSLIQ